MFRIRIDHHPRSITLHVEGKISGECVDELRRVWLSIRNDFPAKRTAVDLSSVLAVDPAGRKLLCQLHAWGTQLSGEGLMIGPLIEEITNES